MKLILQGAGGILGVLAAMALLLFLPAGTPAFWQGWAFLAVWGVASIGISVFLVTRDRALMERRMRGGPTAEKRTSQRVSMWFASALFAAIFVIAGFDRRELWSGVPAYVSVAGNVLVAIGWVVIYFVFRENSFTSATIEVAPDQRVISTGPYSVVRHPMYSGSLLYLIGMPLALGSWWALLAIIAFIPVGAWRMFDEEAFLSRSLAGYTDYMRRVRRRLVPLPW
jgi:protein-S-isoprenylcysteine O-methyltransferase Ste14